MIALFYLVPQGVSYLRERLRVNPKKMYQLEKLLPVKNQPRYSIFARKQ